jgi:hypothetical protein
MVSRSRHVATAVLVSLVPLTLVPLTLPSPPVGERGIGV